ncbi:hypothetical protein [Aeromicrobium sp. CF3.5]|uniref:hypothetical protein n=1 Tax=Aeromicrobium sp. CF3.5 TaxID=3373078 RepID=UPI003EE743F3
MIAIVIVIFSNLLPLSFSGTAYKLIQVIGPLIAGVGLVLGTLMSSRTPRNQRKIAGLQAAGAILQAGVAFTFYYATTDAIGIGFGLAVVMIALAIAAIVSSATAARDVFAMRTTRDNRLPD